MIINEFAHLIADEHTDQFYWSGTAEEVAYKVTAVAMLGLKNITFLLRPPITGWFREIDRVISSIIQAVEDEMLKPLIPISIIRTKPDHMGYHIKR